MTNSIQAPPHQEITPSRRAIDNVFKIPDVMSKILQHLTVTTIEDYQALSRDWNVASKHTLVLIQEQFVILKKELTKLKDDKVISEKLFSELTKDTFLKSKNYIVCETFLNSLTQFREIATKINTLIETQQDTNPEINIDKLNNLRDKFLESLSFKTHIIKTINPAKIGLHQTSNFCYLGELENGRSNGYGICIFANSNTYVGNWKDGQPHGQGTEKLANGNSYEGAWENGIEHGQGIFIGANGNSYKGEWLDGKPNGHGTLSGRDANVIYTGKWLDAKPHGHGIFIDAKGDKYEGNFENGRRHGQGVFTCLNGARYEGEYKDGKRHGQGTFTDADGRVSVGKWEMEM